jgi:hypothetical protein
MTGVADAPHWRAALRERDVKLIDLGYPPGRSGYAEYLESNHWRGFRARYLAVYKPTCRKCRSSEGIELHHVTYARLGNERPDDIEPLCRKHHEAHHEMIRRIDYASRESQKAKNRMESEWYLTGKRRRCVRKRPRTTPPATPLDA